jgi:hypothetical protein
MVSGSRGSPVEWIDFRGFAVDCKSKLRSGSIDETGYAMLIAMDGVRLDLTRHARVTAVGFGF